MTWYKTGTVSVTNGSPNVTLTSGNAQLNIFPDDGFVGPDGRTYAILAVNNATQFVLSENYRGPTVSGQNYVIAPTADHVQLRDMLVGLNTLIDEYETVKLEAGAGRFQDGSTATPGVRGVNHPATGLVWNADGTLSISVNGEEITNIGGVGGLTSFSGPVSAVDDFSVGGDFILNGGLSVDGGDVRINRPTTTFNSSSGANLLFSRGSAGKWLVGSTSNDTFFMTSYVNDPSGTPIFLIDPEGPEGVGTPEIRTYLSTFAEVHSAGHAVTGSMRIIGFSGIAFNDNTANIQNVYGIYGEAVRDAGAGGAQASEFNGANGGNVVDITPYSALGSITTSTWLSAGLTTRPDHNNPLSAAGVMINNGGTFRRGWVLRAGALDPAGPMEFLAVPVNTKLAWYGASGVRTDQIYSTSTTAGGSTTLVLGEAGVSFYNSSSGKPFFSILNISASTVNFPQFRGSTDGQPVEILASGDSANIDLKLTAKGLGRIMMGAYATSGDTPVIGYMVVKDSSGTERKLAVIA